MIAVGEDLAEAMRIAIEVEVLAKQYVLTLQLGGPVLLDDEEMDRVLEKFKTYGKQDL
jgi:L-fuculose-phosphate aldolase